MLYLTRRLLTLQLFKNSIDTQEKLRLNLHSLSVSGLLEYGRKAFYGFSNFFPGVTSTKRTPQYWTCMFN